MKRFATLCIIATAAIQSLGAQIYNTVYDRSGNIYEGYVENRVPGNSMTVKTEKITLVLPADKTTVTYRSHKLSQLPGEYRSAFPNAVDTTVVETCDVTAPNGKSYRDAVLLDSGVSYKFLTFSQSSISLKWNEIFKIENTPCDLSAKEGIKDIVILKSGERIEGQLMEQNISTNRVVFREMDGRKRVLESADILTFRAEPLNADKSILCQAPLRDRLRLIDSQVVEGVIVSKVHGKTVEIASAGRGDIRHIPVHMIMAYEQYPNPDYSVEVETDTAVEEPVSEVDLYVNGNPCKVDELYFEDGMYKVVSPLDVNSVQVKTNNTVYVKLRSAAKTYAVKFYKATTRQEVILRQESSRARKEKVLFPEFKLNSYVPMNLHFTLADGEFIVFECNFATPGVYVLFIEEDETRCVVFDVTE